MLFLWWSNQTACLMDQDDIIQNVCLEYSFMDQEKSKQIYYIYLLEYVMSGPCF